MRSIPIRHVNAFTTTPLEGNPAAVVDGDGLSAEAMQRIALNQKLSETVFLLPPEDRAHHARLRIFTPAHEIPFAGHPTVASAQVLVSEGRVRLAPEERLQLETGAGVIPVEVAGDPPLYTMTQAAPRIEPSALTREEVAEAIGLHEVDVLALERISTGLWWHIAQLASLDVFARLKPDMGALARIEHGVSLFCIGALSPNASIHVRTFAPDGGVPEDPVTGSSNGCIGAFIAEHRLVDAGRDGTIAYVAEQGIEMGQPGRVYVSVTDARDDARMRVHVGGHAVTVLRGELILPD